ncbi:uncharacterized protein BXZ73DRAFT_77644 [Epithele typhae]|uniref:uncharacterized protein n=1 Tax=Epithele typhae TaxID=378194 RepID=UPI0020073637|nr:uncharacterized protein BXZ73DRAFT_77644 [Epithele typhae]KAH9931621.1 hypothetical protein BXZ73DRAFT_77644 [Epithele typhae]
MFAFTHIPAGYTHGHPGRRYRDFSDDNSEFDELAQQAAEQYAAAQARVQEIQRQRQAQAAREQAHRHCRHQYGFMAPRQFDFEEPPSYYPPHPHFARSAPVSAPSHTLEDLVSAALRDEDRQRKYLAHQRAVERQRAIALQQQLAIERQRALAELAARQEAARAREEAARAARVREEGARVARARVEAQRHREHQAMLAILALARYLRAEGGHIPFATQVSAPKPEEAVTSRSLNIPGVPVDRKGKGKVNHFDVDIDVAPLVASKPVSSHETPKTAPRTLKEDLEARIRAETDPEVLESLVILYSDIFDNVAAAPAPVAGPSGLSADEKPASSTPESSPSTPVPEALTEITAVEDALRALQDAFSFPDHLEFSPSRSRSPSPTPSNADGLSYTAHNSPVRAYEHALIALLTRLDAVESNGDESVRARRKEVVREVERALDAVEKRVEAERERSRSRGSSRRGSVTGSEVTVRSAVPAPEVIPKEDAFAVEDSATEVDEEAPKGDELERRGSLSDSAVTIRPSVVPAVALEVVAKDVEDRVVVPESSSGAPSLFSESSDSGLISHADDASTQTPVVDSVDEQEDPSTSVPDVPVDGQALEDISTSEAIKDVEPDHTTSTSEDALDPSLASYSVDPSPTATTAPVEAALSTRLHALEPISRDASASSHLIDPTAGSENTTNLEDAAAASPSSTHTVLFLLSSTPIADPDVSKRRPSAGSDELEIIDKDELEGGAHVGSDWSDLESSDSDGPDL